MSRHFQHHEAYAGCPEIRHGMPWANAGAGFAIDYPLNGAWPEVRQPDGTVVWP